MKHRTSFSINRVFVVLILAGITLRPAVSPGGESGVPKRLKRADSFFGLHFDFHAGMDCKEIGKRTTREMIENVINQTHPDYIQIDCKGHPGLSSYPTKVGNPAPGFVGDPLRLWRDVTAEHGVALFMHYSGVWDSEAIRRHPDWAVVNADGSKNTNATSFFSLYADQLLIPQLRELAGDYGVDGAWVDGECWASQPDYGDAALKAFREATGISGTLQALLESQWCVDVISEHHLAGKMADYPLIVIAECDYLEPAFRQELVSYVNNGGNLLIVGPKAASLFASELGVTLDQSQYEPRYLAYEGHLIATQDMTQTAKLTRKAQVFGQLHTEKDADSASQPAASITALGKGKIAATYFSFSRGYLANHSPQAKAFLNDLCRGPFLFQLGTQKKAPANKPGPCNAEDVQNSFCTRGDSNKKSGLSRFPRRSSLTAPSNRPS